MHAPVLLYLYIRIRDALINFDVLMTEGFGLEVDGRMKAVFPSQEEAQKSAENLKARYPLLQVKVYDAAAHTRAGAIANRKSNYPHRRIISG